MDRVGVRELRHQLRRYLARVQAGESFEVTLLGRPVAELGPPRGPHTTLQQLVDEGKVTPALDPNTTPWPPTFPSVGGKTATEALLAERHADPPMSVLYLDASAITKLVVEEPETAALQAAISDRTLASSRVAVVEVTKATARVNPEADPQPAFARLAFVELDADLAAIAARTGLPALRALDAIHIASALRLGHELEAFVTYDARQANAARSAGLRVESPAAESSAGPSPSADGSTDTVNADAARGDVAEL